MKNSYDAIVVGAGMAGLSVARELAKRRRRVLLLERERTGGVASRAAAGILDPYTEAEHTTPLFQIGLKALEFYPSFLREISKSPARDVEYEKRGVLYLAFNGKDEKFLRDRFAWQKRKGLNVEFLSSSETKKTEPSVRNGVRSGVYYPEIPKLNADKLVGVLFRAAETAGVQIKTSVKDISLWEEKGKVRGVRFSQGRAESPVVVAARGCWAGVDRALGIKIKVKPVRGQILILRSRPECYPKHILHTARYTYIVPWPKGRLLVGSTLEAAGFNNRVTSQGKEDILNRASEIYEEIRGLPVERTWAGLRPYAERSAPVIGPTRIKGLFFAAGYYRSGILISPFVGKLLSEGIVSGKFSPLLRPFFPSRRPAVML